MKDKFLNNIKNYNLIIKGDSILVGYSGGMDSSFLLSLLMEIKEEYELQISAAHLNHLVRGDEALRDENFCKDQCKSYGIPFYSERKDMDGLAEELGISKEAAGRKLRRDFFNRICKENNIKKIALAHNYDDQVETLLMRIFRGTGIDGLAGISYKNENYIRPILNIRRSEIEKYILENDIPYVEDSTNKESEYHRNKIRNDLLPLLEREYNPKISEAIFNLSEIAKIEVDALENLTNDKFEKVVKIEKGKGILDIEKFHSLDSGVRNRIIRKIFEDLTGNLMDLSLENVNEVLNLSCGETGKFIDNINGLKIRNSYGKLIFEKEVKNVTSNLYIELKMGNNIIHEDLVLKVLESTEPSFSENEITIPKEVITDKLIIRNRKNGDRIRPIGLNGTKKLKDIFIDEKIDRELRDNYLIISDVEKIFWVKDLVKSELTQLESINNKYIKLKFSEDKNA